MSLRKQIRNQLRYFKGPILWKVRFPLIYYIYDIYIYIYWERITTPNPWRNAVSETVFLKDAIRPAAQPAL